MVLIIHAGKFRKARDENPPLSVAVFSNVNKGKGKSLSMLPAF
jgi:hypothetical protein